MEKTVMIIIAVVAVLIIIGVIVALKNKSSTDGVDTGPQAHADSASDSAQKAADVSAAAASAAASASTPQEAAAATQQAVAAGAVAQQAAASSAQTAQQVSSGAPASNVDCVLSDWGDYGPCIVDSDGKYFKTKLRTIKVQPSGNGKACETLVNKVSCVPDVDCVLNDSFEFGPCTEEGTGNYIKRGVKTVKIQPSGNGKPCDVVKTAQSCVPPPSAPAPSTSTSTISTFLGTATVSGDACAGYTAGSTAKPIPLACHQQIWKKYCTVPLVESDWAPNYRTLPGVTVDWLDADAKDRSTSTQWKSHCNPSTSASVVSTFLGTATISGDACAGYTAGSATKPIPLACHQQIWKKYCGKPLVESDWAPNYRTLPVVTVDWLDADAKARSTSTQWKTYCN